MREPNIKDFIEDLADKDFVEKLLERPSDGTEPVAQMLYFLQNEQTSTLAYEIESLSPQKSEAVIDSLVRLYPLSAGIIKKLLVNDDTKPINFLNIYDSEYKLLKCINETITKIKDSSTAKSADVKNYQKETERLIADIAALSGKIREMMEGKAEYDEKIKEKAELEKRLAELESNVYYKNLEEDIALIKEQIEEKEKKLADKKRSLKKVTNELQKIDKILNTYDTDRTNKKFKDALRSLQGTIKELPKEE